MTAHQFLSYVRSPGHRADRRIGDNADSVSFRISPCPFYETGTEDAGGQNDWVRMSRIATITVSGHD